MAPENRAREALENQKTIQQIAKDNDIAPTQVSTWKKELETRITEIFERKNAASEAANELKKKSARFECKVGQEVSIHLLIGISVSLIIANPLGNFNKRLLTCFRTGYSLFTPS